MWIFKCMYLCLFVKGREKQNAQCPGFQLSSSFPNILWNLAQLVFLSLCQSRAHGSSWFQLLQDKVHIPIRAGQGLESIHSGCPLMSLLQNVAVLLPYGSELEKPFFISTLLHQKSHLCSSIFCLISIHPSPVIHTFISACAECSSSHSTTILYLILIYLKCEAIKN